MANQRQATQRTATRQCKKSDYGFVYSLTKQLLFPYMHGAHSLKKAEFDADFKKRYAQIHLLLKGSRRIGFYHAVQDSYDKNALYIVRIFLSPSYHGKGIGRALMAHFEHLGYTKIRLQVWKDNPSLAFYKKLGYTILKKNGSRYLLEKKVKPLP